MKYKYRFDRKWARVLIYIRSLYWRKKRMDIVNLQEFKSIAIVYPHLIGDIVMIIPFLRMLRRLAPHAKITFIGASWAKQILRGQNLVDDFICFQNPRAMLGMRAILENWKDVLETLKTARIRQFDLAIEPFGNHMVTLFMSFLKSKMNIGVDFSNLSKLQTYTVPYDVNAHLVDGLMQFFKCLKIRLYPEDYFPKIILSDNQKHVGQDFVKKHGLFNKTIIGIHAGASVASRRWKGFVELISLFCQNISNVAICVFCGPSDDLFIKDIISSINPTFTKQILIIKKDMEQYIAILGICSHVICNDSSCGHISAALGVPVTVLFAQGDPRFIAPRGVHTVNIISKDFPCKPCLQNECPKKTNECFTWITPEIVFKAVQENIIEERKRDVKPDN